MAISEVQRRFTNDPSGWGSVRTSTWTMRFNADEIALTAYSWVTCAPAFMAHVTRRFIALAADSA